jgi:hypothetical protein
VCPEFACAAGFACTSKKTGPATCTRSVAGGSPNPNLVACAADADDEITPDGARVCVAAGGADEPCRIGEDPCDAGLLCVDHGAAMTMCRTIKKLGAACVDPRECDSGLICDAHAHKCVALPGVGEPCAPDGDLPMKCDPLRATCDTSGAAPVCVPLGRTGATCDFARRCDEPGGFVCSPGGTCVAASVRQCAP